MSGGGQWRALRHILSLSNLQTEADKLAPRDQLARRWDQLVRRVQAAVSLAAEGQHQPAPAALHRDADQPDSKEADGKQAESKRADSKQADSKRADSKQADSRQAQSMEVGNKRADSAEADSKEAEPRATELSVEGLLAGLRRKKDLALGNISQPTWKDNKPTINKSSIHSRTAYVISALASAESAACCAKRVADYIHHINQYPEARDYAIREGAVRALLRVQDAARRQHGPDADELRAVVNEALALMGWVGPPGGPGPRVLALDGGGIRGLIAIEMLRQLERLTGRPVRELFDLVVGVSTGAILAAVVAGGGGLERAARLYRELARDMFGGTSLLGGASRLVLTHSYYDSEQWERLLRANLGELALPAAARRGGPQLALVSAAVGAGALQPFLFRTYGAGWRRRGALRGSSAAQVWQAVRASAAAPTYFTEYTLAGDVHQDGGILLNNPCGAAVHEARLLWGGAALARGAVLSLGTGRPPAAPPRAPQPTSWRDKFERILDSATDTEAVHLLLNDLLPPGSYYRFNPPLLEPCPMDEVRPARLDAMLTATHAYIRRNQHKFSEAAARLVRPRGPLQRAGDELHRRALLLGLTTHY